MADCPECRIKLPYNAKSCSCGWGARNNDRKPPPNVLDTLVDEITRIGTHKFRGLPVSSPADIARFWISHNKPADEVFEIPKEISTIAKDGTRWVCPYHLRLIATLRAFILLSPADRRVVLAGIEDEKVWWRGESVKHYVNIIDETHKMRAMGIESYREETIKRAKEVLRAMVNTC